MSAKKWSGKVGSDQQPREIMISRLLQLKATALPLISQDGTKQKTSQSERKCAAQANSQQLRKWLTDKFRQTLSYPKLIITSKYSRHTIPPLAIYYFCQNSQKKGGYRFCQPNIRIFLNFQLTTLQCSINNADLISFAILRYLSAFEGYALCLCLKATSLLLPFSYP